MLEAGAREIGWGQITPNLIGWDKKKSNINVILTAVGI